MQTGYILGFFILPIFLEGCCEGNRKQTEMRPIKATGQQNYRAVEGEIFMVTCSAGVRCNKTGEGNEGISFVCGEEFLAETKYSGNYTCSGSKLLFRLQVLNRTNVSCFQPNENHVHLYWTKGGKIPCPGLSCSSNTTVTWYTPKEVSEQHRPDCQKSGQLQLCNVKDGHAGLYFCDKQISEKEVSWTFRMAVNVTTGHTTETDPPKIIDPGDNTTELVELGRPHTLTCKVHFPFEESNFSPGVQWFRNYDDITEKMNTKMQKQPQTEFVFIGTAIITEVTRQNLKHTYTCIANNTFGSRNVTIELKEKMKVNRLMLFIYPIAPLLLVAGLVFVLHVKWLEIQLIYRSHFHYGKQNGDGKDFDVLLSYVWSPSSAEAEGVVALDIQKNPDDEARLSSTDLLKATRRPPEDLLPEVLEDSWGYHLCLLERDLLPGGVYTDDVALAIQRSQMLICLLSADYLSNTNAVFVLESGIRALLQNSNLKLLLIWTSRASASLIQLDPPLPTLVQRALKVLPSLDWPSGKPATDSRKFWRSLKKAVPNQR